MEEILCPVHIDKLSYDMNEGVVAFRRVCKKVEQEEYRDIVEIKRRTQHPGSKGLQPNLEDFRLRKNKN